MGGLEAQDAFESCLERRAQLQGLMGAWELALAPCLDRGDARRDVYAFMAWFKECVSLLGSDDDPRALTGLVDAVMVRRARRRALRYVRWSQRTAVNRLLREWSVFCVRARQAECDATRLYLEALGI